ncbi:MAG: tyrosine-protein phosphatase [Elusimicrobiota bacterium]
MSTRNTLAVMMVLAASALPLRAAQADTMAALAGLAGAEAAREALPAASAPEAPAGAQFKELNRAPGTDITAEYKDILRSVAAARDRAGDIRYRQLSGYRILFVPGFMTNPSINPGLVYKSAGSGVAPEGSFMPTYFYEQIKWLRANGLDAGIVKIESEAGIKYNANLIEAAIQLSPTPVIIISHSKGGLDTLETLVRRPNLRDKVKGLVSIQSPYYGTPIADWVLSHEHSLSPMSALVLKLMGGSMQSVNDLSVKSRLAYQAENADAIAAITAAIPTISFGAWKNEEKGVMDTNFETTRDLMLGWGIKSDGLVPVNSEMLQGANQIAVEGLDHLATVLEVKKPAFDRVDFFRTLLTLLMEKGVPALEAAPKPEPVGGLIHTGDKAEPMHFGRVDISKDSDLRGIAYRGGNPSPETYQFLKDRGVDTIINIRNMTKPNWKKCEETGIKCENYPVWALDPGILGGVTYNDRDLGGIVLHENKNFLKAFDAAVAELQAGRNIYIHCQGGTDRTGALATALTIRSYACGKNFDSHELKNEVMDTLHDFGFWTYVFPSWKTEIRGWIDNFGQNKEWLCK